MESLCALPLISGERCRGVLFFMAERRAAYDGLRRDFLEQVAGAVAVALDDCLAHEEVRRLRDRLGGGERLPAGGDPAGAQLRRDRRPQRGAAPGAVAGRDGGADQRDGADPRRDRHRQGADRARDPRPQPAARAPAGQGQLLGDLGRPGGERAVRPRQRRVHRRGHGAQRALRAGGRRHHLPRRDRRAAAGDAGQAAARAAGAASSSRSAATRRGASTCA